MKYFSQSSTWTGTVLLAGFLVLNHALAQQNPNTPPPINEGISLFQGQATPTAQSAHGRAAIRAVGERYGASGDQTADRKRIAGAVDLFMRAYGKSRD